MSINVTVTGNPVCCTKRNYLLADPDVTKKNEFNRRRKLRLEQVRQQSKDLASHLRQEFRKEREKQINKFEQEQISELAKWQARRLLSLQEKYQECISQVGTGHRQAAEEPDYGSILAEQRNRQQSAAKKRGKIAADLAKQESEQAQAKANEVAERHKLKRAVEDLRSSMIASIGKTNTKETHLQKITVNVPANDRETSVKTIRTTSGEDQQETIVKTYYKGTSPTKLKKKPKSPVVTQKALKKGGRDSFTLDLTELNKSGTSFERSDAAESSQDVSKYTSVTYSKTTKNEERNVTKQDSRNKARNAPLQLPIVDASEENEDIVVPMQRQDNKASRSKRLRDETREDADEEMRDVGVQVGASQQTSRATEKGGAAITRHQRRLVAAGSARRGARTAQPGSSCYCPENPGPSSEEEEEAESSSEPSEQQVPRPLATARPATTRTTASSAGGGGGGKVQMYDHTGRYHREYEAPTNVERVPRDVESARATATAAAAAEHVGHRQRAAAAAAAAAEAQRAAVAAAKQRGQDALGREMVRRDYRKLMGDLQTLSREERLARGSQPARPVDQAHLSERRRDERATRRQHEMATAFEAVLHRTQLPGQESMTSVAIVSSSSQEESLLVTPAKLNVGELPAPVPDAPVAPRPKYVFVVPFSPDFSDTSVVVGVDVDARGQTDGTDGADGQRRDDTHTARRRLEHAGRPSPRSDASRSPSPDRRQSPERRFPDRRSPDRRPKSPRRSGSPDARVNATDRGPVQHALASEARRRSPPRKGSPSSIREATPDSAGTQRSRTPSPRSGGASTVQDTTSSSPEVISLEALMERVHAQRTLLLEEVGRDVLAALPRDAAFLKRGVDNELSGTSSEGSATEVKQLWAESTSETEVFRPPPPPKRSRKKQQTTPTDTESSATSADASPNADPQSSMTTSFDGIEIVVSVRDKSPQPRRDVEDRVPNEAMDETDRAGRREAAATKPRARRRVVAAAASTSTSYASPPDRLEPPAAARGADSEVVSALLGSIDRHQATFAAWKASMSARRPPTPSLQAYVHRLLDMSRGSIDRLGDESHVTTPSSSVVDDADNRDDRLDALLSDRADEVSRELVALAADASDDRAADADVLLQLAEAVARRRRRREAGGAETQRRPREDVRRDSLEKRGLRPEAPPPPPPQRVRLVDREKLCSERISSLAEQIERVRLERQLIVESSASTGASANASAGSPRDSTRYESPPLEVVTPMLMPLSPPPRRSPRSQRSNGNDETRYESPPSSVATPSLLTTRLSPPPGTPMPSSNRSVGASQGSAHRDRTANRNAPPASLWRTNGRPAAAVLRRHELSVIAEAETPRLELSDLPDVMAEMLRRRLISSPLHFARDSSAAAAESSSGTSEGRLESNGSPPEDLDREFKRLGFGWAGATLRKTQATRDLSSSSSPESFLRPRRRSAAESTPARSHERSAAGSPPPTSHDRSSQRSPPRTAHERSYSGSPSHTSHERSSQQSPPRTAHERSYRGSPSRKSHSGSPARTSHGSSAFGSPQRSILKSPPQTSRGRSTPLQASDASQGSGLSFHAQTDISTVHSTGSEERRS